MTVMLRRLNCHKSHESKTSLPNARGQRERGRELANARSGLRQPRDWEKARKERLAGWLVLPPPTPPPLPLDDPSARECHLADQNRAVAAL